MPQSSISSGSDNLTLDEANSFLTANAKGTLPLNEKFNLVGKFGLGANFASMTGNANIAGKSQSVTNNSNNFVVLLGAGAEYNLTEHVSFNLMDSYYINTAPAVTINTNPSSGNFSFGNTNYISLGMNYVF